MFFLVIINMKIENLETLIEKRNFKYKDIN